jgi:hypothetical protein
MATPFVDRLSRVLAAPAPRRHVAATLVLLAGDATAREAAANQGNPCPTCQHHAGNQGRRCAPDPDGTPCLANGACKGGQCLTACPDCQQWTGTRCVPRKNGSNCSDQGADSGECWFGACLPTLQCPPCRRQFGSDCAPVPRDTPCSDPDNFITEGFCDEGYCWSTCQRDHTDGQACNHGDGLCWESNCYPPPACRATGSPCVDHPIACCGLCNGATNQCLPVIPFGDCDSDDDCVQFSCVPGGDRWPARRRCIGYHCEWLDTDFNCV